MVKKLKRENVQRYWCHFVIFLDWAAFTIGALGFRFTFNIFIIIIISGLTDRGS